MKHFLLLALITVLLSPIAVKAESYTSILKKTKDTVNKIEIRNQEQCDKKAEKFPRLLEYVEKFAMIRIKEVAT